MAGVKTKRNLQFTFNVISVDIPVHKIPTVFFFREKVHVSHK